MTGTLYISSLRYEWNVWSLFRRKAADVLRHYRSFPKVDTSAEVFQRSAAELDCLPDGSVDMVFMDPPFGSNIFYADSSLLWEAWPWRPDRVPATEIVVNKHRALATGGKTVEDYGDLMRRSFSHAARVLKPGGRAILCIPRTPTTKSGRRFRRHSGMRASRLRVCICCTRANLRLKASRVSPGKEHVTTLDLVLCLKQAPN